MGDTERAPSRKSILDMLHAIDKRLEIIVKFIGYFSILVATPALFILAQIGIDLKQMFSGPELTAAQTEMIASIKARGHDVSDKGAIKALNEGQVIFTDFLKAGVLPSRDDAGQSLAALYRRGQIPVGDSEMLKGWLINDIEVMERVRPLLDSSNKLITDLAADTTVSTVGELCSSLGAYLENGDFGYRVDVKDNCNDVFEEGTGGVYIVNLINTTRVWNDLAGIAQPPKVSTARLIELATLGLSVSASPTPLTPQLFEQSPDGRLYRFRVDAKENSTLALIEIEQAYRLAVRNQDPELPKKEVFKIYLHTQYSDDWLYKSCNQGATCLLDFDAIFFGSQLYLIKINQAEPGDNELWAYVDDYQDWSSAK